MKRAALAVLIVLAGCAAEPTPEGPPAADYVAHEWGTFTSVQSSDGREMAGLHHEHEPPPPFVHHRALVPPGSLAPGEALAAPVTQNMETPVIYFHSPERRAVHVEVDFPDGLISEWYPRATAALPAPAAAGGLLDPKDGSMSWDVVLEPGLGDLPPPWHGYFWLPVREVAATPVMHRDAPAERDRFIFYRGLGRFSPALRVRAAGGMIDLDNQSRDAVPVAFLLRVEGERGVAVDLGRLPAGQRRVAVPAPPTRDLASYVDDAAGRLALALEATGLHRDEALAMVNTWRKSYFQTPGLRLLYVLPRGWTDALLPLRITPAPRALVRTLVGRVEVLTREDELALTATLEDAAPRATPLADLGLGPFAEPRVRRALELMTSPDARRYAESILAQAIDFKDPP